MERKRFTPHSRANTSPDTRRLSEAVGRPGIDPRTWVSLAVVKDVHLDPAHGYFADVILHPSEVRDTARVGTEYAGAGWGMHMPVLVDDEVLVTCPSGDVNDGLVITRRLHSAADKPPQDAIDHPDDAVLVVREGKNFHLRVAGAGNVYIRAVTGAKGGKIQLAPDSGTKGVARLDDTTKNGKIALTVAAVGAGPEMVTTITLTYSPPGGGADQLATIALTGAVTGAVAGTLNLAGQIDKGSATVTAGD